MSISLGIYDIFANLLPGLLYLFAINEILKSLTLPHMELNSQTFNLESFIVLALGYLLGHIFNSFTYAGWYRLFYRSERKNYASARSKALKNIQANYSHLKMKFYPHDAELLFNAIQVKNKELADRIEATRANAIMMRNISFGLFLLIIAQVIYFINSGFSLNYLGLGLACIFGSAASLYQTAKYYEWFYKDVFLTAINYGSTLQEVVTAIRNTKPKR